MSGPAEDAAIREQVEQALKKMTLYMAVGLVALVILAVVASSLRGVFILAAIVYLFGSLGAQWYLRRRFLGPLKG
jgi:ABC-type bacteriocin/lantibiotic exporter with double-glycine peptidase domain